MAHWYTADPHFGHNNILKFQKRPFRSITQMDTALIMNITAVVQPDDDLWIVGDFGFGGSAGKEGYLEGVFHRIPGRKHLIVGNHDDERVQNLPWESCSQLTEFTDGETMVTLCHYPMITWNRARKGAIQIFGHVHSSWRGTRNSVNVGVDVWDYRPVQIDDILARAKGMPMNRHWDDVEHGKELV